MVVRISDRAEALNNTNAPLDAYQDAVPLLGNYIPSWATVDPLKRLLWIPLIRRPTK